ncbi:MAG TPA: Hsp70 family protein [Candidatus Eisenbacteria bacterium]|nr:Hsp70 family protein [Candidatus Eisenbacteria bacterium]
MIGIDFGTTNSAVAMADEFGHVKTARYPSGETESETFRSILFFVPPQNGMRRELSAYAGPDAIEHYLHAEDGGRLIQSIKSYLANSSLKSTSLFGKSYRFEELVGYLLRSLKTAAGKSGIPIGTKAVVGRPVRFVGSTSHADDVYATKRLTEALAMAGITEVHFEFEPVAAAYSYEASLKKDELLLVADFGGGTTDFTLIRVGPDARKRNSHERVLASAGVGIAGDSFDAKLVRHLVAPLLGRGSQWRLMGKTGTVPNWPFAKLEHWHHLSFLKSNENMETLRSLRARALEPDKIELFIMLVTEDLGFQLHRAVQHAKYELSVKKKATFSFRVPGIHVSQTVARAEFEDWISDELHAIASCVDQMLKSSGVKPSEVDKAFLTGGSSFVPAVREIFEHRFGSDRIVGGSEFTSVAKGLALRSRDLSNRKPT